MRKALLSLVLLFVSFKGFAFLPPDNVRISVLTCDPGEQLFSAFGHTAVRVVSPDGDWIYNYGTFDSSEDGFFLKFMKGELLYFVSRVPYDRFEMEYISENRTITEQELNLTPRQREAVMERIAVDMLPANRHYKYDFVLNNCTTKVYGLIADMAAFPEIPESRSFRQLINASLDNTAFRFGLNILFGKNADLPLSAAGQYCLPAGFMNGLELWQNHDGEALVKNTTLIFDSGKGMAVERFLGYAAGLLIVFMVYLLVSGRNAFYAVRALLYCVLLVTGLIGLAIAVMWAFGFILVEGNINILWANPLNLILLFVRKGRLVTRYALYLNISFILLFLILIATRFHQYAGVFILLSTAVLLTYAAFLKGSGQRNKRISV